MLSTLLLLGFGAYAVMLQGQWLVLSLWYIPVMWCQYIADKGRRQDPVPALLPHCRVEQGQCYIGETALPRRSPKLPSVLRLAGIVSVICSLLEWWIAMDFSTA